MSLINVCPFPWASGAVARDAERTLRHDLPAGAIESFRRDVKFALSRPSGEVLTRVFEELGPGGLHAFARHAVPDVPIPAARTLEEAVVPSADSVLQAANRLLK